MAYYLDGRVSALWGTHTHVPTADECVFPGGTGYITLSTPAHRPVSLSRLNTAPCILQGPSGTW